MCIDYILYSTPSWPEQSSQISDTMNFNIPTQFPLLPDISTPSSSSQQSSTQHHHPPIEIIETLIPCCNLLNTSRYRPYGFQAKCILDLLSMDSVGNERLPNSNYPSDHIAVVADIDIIHVQRSGNSQMNNNSNNSDNNNDIK